MYQHHLFNVGKHVLESQGVHSVLGRLVPVSSNACLDESRLHRKTKCEGSLTTGIGTTGSVAKGSVATGSLTTGSLTTGSVTTKCAGSVTTVDMAPEQ